MFMSERMKKLEEDVPKLQAKFDDILTDVDSLNYRDDFQDKKIDSAVKEIKEIRERLEEIQEQEFVYEN